MGNNWKSFKLTDLGTIARGKSKHRPRDASHLYGGKFPFVQTGDIKASNHRLNSHTQTYSDAGLAQSRLWPRDTMCITIAANIAETAILNYPACFPDSIIGFVANNNICDIDFVEYLMRHFKKQIQTHSIGSVQDNINLETFQRVTFLVPPLPEQRAIASILSALDDKIELNLQMNKTLEEMAMTLYKHWFVDFGPFRDGEFVNSELGEIPKGWEVKRLSELAYFKNGKGLSSDFKHENGKYKVFGSNGEIGRTDEVMFDEPVIAIGRVGANYGEVHYSIQPCWISDNAVTAQPFIQGYFWWLLQTLRLIDYNQFVSGSAQPLITQGAIKDINCRIPSDKLLIEFSNKLETLFLQLQSNLIENQILSSLRDTLLPKLISGEVRVKDAAKSFAEVL